MMNEILDFFQIETTVFSNLRAIRKHITGNTPISQLRNSLLHKFAGATISHCLKNQTTLRQEVGVQKKPLQMERAET